MDKKTIDTLMRCTGDLLSAEHKWLEGEQEAYMHLLSLAEDIKSYSQFIEVTETLASSPPDFSGDLDIAHGKYVFYMKMARRAKEWGYNCLGIRYNNNNNSNRRTSDDK